MRVMLFVRRASVVEAYVEWLELDLFLMDQWLRERSGRRIHEVTISMTECIATRLELHVDGVEAVAGSPAPPNVGCGPDGWNRGALEKAALS